MASPKTLYKLTVQTPSMNGPLHLQFTSEKLRADARQAVADEYGWASIIETHPGYVIHRSVEEAMQAVRAFS